MKCLNIWSEHVKWGIGSADCRMLDSQFEDCANKSCHSYLCMSSFVVWLQHGWIIPNWEGIQLFKAFCTIQRTGCHFKLELAFTYLHHSADVVKNTLSMTLVSISLSCINLSQVSQLTLAVQSPTVRKFFTKKGFLWRAYTGPWCPGKTATIFSPGDFALRLQEMTVPCSVPTMNLVG